MRNGGFFIGGEAAQDVKLITHSHLVQTLIISGAMPLLLNTSLYSAQGKLYFTAFTFIMLQQTTETHHY
jgi:hypothetical protein